MVLSGVVTGTLDGLVSATSRTRRLLQLLARGRRGVQGFALGLARRHSARAQRAARAHQAKFPPVAGPGCHRSRSDVGIANREGGRGGRVLHPDCHAARRRQQVLQVRVRIFLARERALGRDDLVFPIHYILGSRFAGRGGVARRSGAVDRRQTPICRLALLPPRRRRLARLRASHRALLWQDRRDFARGLLSPDERRQLEAEARRRAEDEERVRREAEPKRRADDHERLGKEALAKKLAEREAREREEAERQRQESEAKKRAEEEERARQEAEARGRAEEEGAKRRHEEAETQRRSPEERDATRAGAMPHGGAASDQPAQNMAVASSGKIWGVVAAVAGLALFGAAMALLAERGTRPVTTPIVESNPPATPPSNAVASAPAVPAMPASTGEIQAGTPSEQTASAQERASRLATRSKNAAIVRK